MTDLNKAPLIEIRKDEKNLYWLEYPDEMTDHEVLGILHMMVKRLEGAIEKEEVHKTNTHSFLKVSANQLEEICTRAKRQSSRS